MSDHQKLFIATMDIVSINSFVTLSFMKKIIWIVVAVLVIGGLIYAVQRSSTPAVDVAWAFQEKTPVPMTGAPVVQVTTTINGTEYDAGTYNGSCIEIDEENLSENEVSGIICWWAGFGDEIGVFTEEGKIVAKHGEIQEGDEGAAPFRGNLTTLFEI